MILLFLVSKFHILVKYPCNIRFCCTINLTERITKYRLDFDTIIQYQKDKMSLWSQTSVFRVLSLPFGIRPLPCNSVPKLHETFPTNIGRYSVLPVLMPEYQCHQKITTFHIILSNLRNQAPVKYHTNFPNCILSTIPNT